MNPFFLLAFSFSLCAMETIDQATKRKIAQVLCEHVWAIPKQEGKTRVSKSQLKLSFELEEMQKLVNGLVQVDDDNRRYLIKPGIGIVQVLALAQEHVSSK